MASPLLVVTGLAFVGPGSAAEAPHGAKHHIQPRVSASMSEGSHFTLSGNIHTTLNNKSREQGCIGESISVVEGEGKEAEIASTGVQDFGTFKLPDPEVVQTFAVLYPVSAAKGEKSSYYSWTEPTGTITLTQTAHGGVKGSLDLTLHPGYYSGTDSRYHNEASSAEKIKGSWSCPLS